MRSEARKLRKNLIQTISYACPTPGPKVEEGTIDGFWTGEIDTWGKRTIRSIHGEGVTYYLFDREIVSVEDYEGEGR